VQGEHGVAAGAAPTGLVKTTNDLYAYGGSASASDPDQAASWTWSVAGSP
jgi:hypothetical protein